MKLSTSIFFTDLLPHKRKLYHKIVKNNFFDKDNPEKTVKNLKALGFDGVELLLPQYLKLTKNDLSEAKNLLESHHLPILSIHQQLRLFTKTSIAEITELFNTASFLGAKVIVLHTSNAGKQLFHEPYIKTIHALQKKYGIMVGFENMERYIGGIRPKHFWHGETFAQVLKKNDFHITLDTTHLAHSGDDVVSFLKKHHERIVNIHLSDYKNHLLNGSLRPMRYKHMVLGKGELKILDFVSFLKKVKYTGLVTLEIHADFAGIKASITHIHSVLKK